MAVNESTDVRTLRARVASAKRWKQDNAADLQRELREAMLERQIVAAVSTWPPLTNEQRARLSTLLAPGGESL